MPAQEIQEIGSHPYLSLICHFTSDRVNHKPAELSGGEQQRVAIARALINDPELLLADEPTGNLDSKSADRILSLLKELNKQGQTIVLVTHEESLAEKTKRVIKLFDGKIVENRQLNLELC